MPRLQRAVPEIFVHQADAVLNQANPVSGTLYTVLDTTKNVRLIALVVKVTFSVQPTPLEVHITVDGQTLLFSQTDPSSATNYYLFVHPTAPGLTITGEELTRKPFVLEGRSMKIEVEITGGTVSNLYANAMHAKRR